jgi:hypothetical protein
LANYFGNDEAYHGGEDERVFVLKYSASNLNYNTNALFLKIKADLEALTGGCSLKSAQSRSKKKTIEDQID